MEQILKNWTTSLAEFYWSEGFAAFCAISRPTIILTRLRFAWFATTALYSSGSVLASSNSGWFATSANTKCSTRTESSQQYQTSRGGACKWIPEAEDDSTSFAAEPRDTHFSNPNLGAGLDGPLETVSAAKYIWETTEKLQHLTSWAPWPRNELLHDVQ